MTPWTITMIRDIRRMRRERYSLEQMARVYPRRGEDEVAEAVRATIGRSDEEALYHLRAVLTFQEMNVPLINGRPAEW